ncbi:MAG: AAA family ATPase, partial [Atopobiaceae bacterium]|nr:AAA family ATPase [Atopobiaceae bacterium]
MYLKTLTLKGFKSFADRTHMVFDPGLTVVVGPNGSGKSNVSDAILWVLGEQSARMLRGQSMEDVIFSGSSARQAVGVAEVTLVLDNSDHTLPIDFDEVGITRRMYRSGESEYLINGAPARLMDIQDILHDSGLGKETHSIISQGKLDSVLSSKPEERRTLIEEAAGISKHKRRKERSQRKLKSMDENLVRAKDISREITRQLRPLERQVDKARRAGQIESRLAELTTTLAVNDLRRLQREWGDVEARGKVAEAEVELARYRVEERQAELERLQSMLEQKGLFVGDLGEQRRRMQDTLGRIGSDMRLLEEKGRNMLDRLSEMRMNLSTMERQRAEAVGELGRSRTELAEAQAAHAHLTEEVSRLVPAAAAAREARVELDG